MNEELLNEMNEELLKDVTAHLASAISLLERGAEHGAMKAAPSNKMFKQMLADYNASLARARVVLSHSSSAMTDQEFQDFWGKGVNPKRVT
jgi:hypothetical protein